MSDAEETEYISLNSSQSGLKKIDKIFPISKDDFSLVKTIEVISDLLNNICEENKDKSEIINKNIIPFMTQNIPSMSIKDYLLRLSQFTKMSESTIIIILIYIDRISNLNNFRLTYRNIYKLILSAMIIAIKYNEDLFFSSAIYAKLGGLSVSELNYLEFQFLILIKFSLFIENDLFDKYKNNLLSLQDEEDEDEDDNQDEDEDEDENKSEEKEDVKSKDNNHINNFNVNNNDIRGDKY
jgi:hypothetical protein